MHPGQGPGLGLHDLGETGSSETVTLLESEMLAHSHFLSVSQADTLEPSPTNQQFATGIGIAMYATPGQLVSLNPNALPPASGDAPHNNLQPCLTYMWPLCIFLGGFAMLSSAVFHRRALAIAIPGAVLVGMYFVNALGNLVEKMEDLQPLSVFYYYGSAIEEDIEWADFGGVTLAASVPVLLAAFAFNWRDIYT